MARDIFSFQALIPAGTAKATPVTVALTLPTRIVQELEVLTPPGPRGEVGWAIGLSGENIIPTQRGQFIVTDDEVIRWPLEGYPDSGAWQLFGYNTGVFDHTIYVRFLTAVISEPAQVGLRPAPAGDLIPPP